MISHLNFYISQIIRLFTLISFALTCSLAIALDINLICDVKSINTYSSGTVAHGKGVALIEISEAANLITILITSNDENSDKHAVSTGSDTNKIVRNWSTANKWDIENIFTSSGSRTTRRVVIDRTAGLLIVNQRFEKNGMHEVTNVSGTCMKNDSKTKKF